MFELKRWGGTRVQTEMAEFIDHSRNIMLFVCHPKIVHKHCLQFLLGVKMARRETENNAYTKFWGDKQRALWYVMVFSGVANCLAVPVLKKT